MADKIKVDIDELIDRLEQLRCDGYVTAEFQIYDTEFFEGAGN